MKEALICYWSFHLNIQYRGSLCSCTYLRVLLKSWLRSELWVIIIDKMGGLCSRSSTVDNAPGGSFPLANGHLSHGSGIVYQSRGLPPELTRNLTASPIGGGMDNKQLREPLSAPEMERVSYGVNPDDIDDGIPRLSRALSHKSRSTKSKQVAVAKVSRRNHDVFFTYTYIFFVFDF